MSNFLTIHTKFRRTHNNLFHSCGGWNSEFKKDEGLKYYNNFNFFHLVNSDFILLLTTLVKKIKKK